jgi:CRP-like cAMP-binding protein
MQVHTLAPFLKELPFFQGMDQQHLDRLVGCATNLRFDAGQYLFREGEKADRFFIIRQGAVDLELQASAGRTLKLEAMHTGDVIGWSWLFPPYAWAFSAEARELTRVIAMDGECVREKCKADATLGYELMTRFAQIVVDRLQHTRHRLLKLSGGADASD